MCLQFNQSGVLNVGILGPLGGWVEGTCTAGYQEEGGVWDVPLLLLSGQANKCRRHSSYSCVNNSSEEVMGNRRIVEGKVQRAGTSKM